MRLGGFPTVFGAGVGHGHTGPLPPSCGLGSSPPSEVSSAATRPFGFFLDSLRPCLAKGLLADNPVAGDALFPTPIAAPCDGNVWQRCGAVHHFIMYSLVESFTLYPAQRHKSS